MIALQSVARALVSILLVSGAASAQQRSDAEISAEIAFARGLASDWSFVDLAEDVVARVERDGVSARMGEQLGLVKCDVYAQGARSETEPARRRQLFEQALDAYTDFVDQHPRSEARPAAEASFVEAAAQFARVLELDLEEAVGDEVEQLGERRSAVLQVAVEKTADLIAELESAPERTEAETRELHLLMLNRGNMLADLAQSLEDGTWHFEQAIDTLESLVFEAGEGTPWALRAYVAIGKVYAGQGFYEDAAAYYEAVIDQSIPLDPAAWDDMLNTGMTDEEKQLRFRFLEWSVQGLLDAYLSAGDVEAACAMGLHYYNTQRREGFSFTPDGYMSLLAVARALLESAGYVGGNLADGTATWFGSEDDMKQAFSSRREQRSAIDLALRIAQTVNEENKRTMLQVRAQKLLSAIIERPGVTPSPDILYEAAEGEYLDQNYVAALGGFRRVLREVESADQATRIEYGSRVMNKIGNCYRKMDRPLESALAFREGATTWLGDPQYDSTNAQGYYTMITNFSKQATSEKDVLEELISEAERIVAEEGDAKRDEVLYNLGKKAERKPKLDFAGAIEKYNQIEEGSDYWEKAIVQISVCRFRMEDIDQALIGLDEYLDVTLEDPKHATTNPKRLAKRKEAMATAEFYRGLILFSRAIVSGDEATLRRITELLKAFHEDYAEQSKLAPWTMQMVMQSHLALGERDEARATLTTLIEKYPDEKRTGQASIQFYDALDGVFQASTDPEEKSRVLREMAEHLERANGSSSSASFANLRRESKHWTDLGEWAKAEGVLQRLVTRFDSDPEQAEALRKYIKPDLGAALLKQRKVAEAKAVLAPLATNTEKRASRATVINWCLAVTGWLEGAGDAISIVPGAGETAEEFQEVVTKMSAIASAGEKWTSCEWYEQKLMVVYTYYVWSQSDSRKLDSARNQMGTIEAETGASFDPVSEFCDADDTDPDVRERLGGRVLQQRYMWLRRKLNE